MRPHPHADPPKHPTHPLYHHRPQHEPDRPYRSDKPLYHPPRSVACRTKVFAVMLNTALYCVWLMGYNFCFRPDSEKQFQPAEPEKSYLSSQKSYMQSEKPFMQNEKPFLPSEKPYLPSEKPEKSDKGYSGGKDGGEEGKMAEGKMTEKPSPPSFPLRPEAKPAPLAPHPHALPHALPYLAPHPHDPPPPPFYPSYPPPYGPNPFTAAAVSRSSFYPPPPTYYPPFPTYPQHPPPP